jgi:hypothetical protein
MSCWLDTNFDIQTWLLPIQSNASERVELVEKMVPARGFEPLAP